MAAGSSSHHQSSLARLLFYLKPHRTKVLWGMVTLFVVNIMGVYLPLVLRDGINELQSNFDYHRIIYYAGVILVLASAIWGIRILSRMLLFGVGRQVEFELKQRVFDHLLTLDPGYFALNPVGDLINRATSDLDNIRRLLGFAVLSMANTIFAYGLTLPAMLHLNVRLTLLGVAVYPVMLVLVQIFGNSLRSQQLQVQQQLSQISDLIQEDMSGIALIKIYAQEQNEAQAFQERNRQLLEANLKLARTRNTLFPLVGGIAYISLLIVLWVGGGDIARGSLTIADFITLILYVQQLVFPTALLGFTITAYQRGEVSIDRLEEILSVQPQLKDHEGALTLPLELVQGRITARHLTYQYPGAPRPSLSDISFEVNPGEILAIVGPVGAGKSTLANSLPRLLDIAPGQLFLDDIDITTIRLSDLRRAIAYVPQDSFLFSTQISNNIRYGEPLATQPLVESIARSAQIHSEILNFPRQYETIVGERGITLSGGQRQRTALARALLVEAPVLILDDSLASVDNQTALEILHNLAASSRRKTVLLISHQLGAAAQADRILVLDQGRVVQEGTHQALLEEPGLYRSLWDQHQLRSLIS